MIKSNHSSVPSFEFERVGGKLGKSVDKLMLSYKATESGLLLKQKTSCPLVAFPLLKDSHIRRPLLIA